MAAPNDPDRELPTSQHGIDQYLSEILEGETNEAEPSTNRAAFNPDPDKELTLYGAMRLAADRAVNGLRGRKLSGQANAFRSFLIDIRNKLRS